MLAANMQPSPIPGLWIPRSAYPCSKAACTSICLSYHLGLELASLMWALEVGRRLFGHGLQGSGFPKQSMERVHFEEDGDTVGEEPEQDTQGRGSSHLASWM